jgi:hypothetical protein
MFALGFNVVVPLSETVGTVCDIAGIICALLFLGLAEDPGPQDNPLSAIVERRRPSINCTR